MTSLTPEQKAYKQKTLEQLLVNLPLLQAQLPQETRREIANSLKNQLEDMHRHIDLLQRELAANTAIEPAADELFQRAAAALTKNKFYLAKRLINKLETIEPFYPGIDRLRQEAEAGRASRRTQAMAQGGPASRETRLAEPDAAAAPSLPEEHNLGDEEPPKKGLAQFFQFHIIISCLLVLLILCVIASVGGMMLLQWLIEGQ
jgi:hypothetical protein